MNKKAISPLAATVILVIFAIMLGAITMSLGRGYERQEISKEPSFAKCKMDPSIAEIKSTNLVDNFTVKDGNLNLVLGSIIQITTNDMRAEVIGEKGTQEIELGNFSFVLQRPLEVQKPISDLGNIREIRIK